VTNRNYIFGGTAVIAIALLGLFVYSSTDASDEIVVTSDAHSTAENNSSDENRKAVPAVDVKEANNEINKDITE